MDNERSNSLQSTLRVYRLPENASAQQPLIERAEEDLLCALSLYRRGVCGYLPLVNICFLLHQTLEKWLKAFIAVQGITASARGQHDLYRRFEAVENKESAFGEIWRMIKEVAPEILDHKFPGNLRYNETPADIEQYVEVLLKATFAVRRIVKRKLNETKEGHYELP